MDGGSSWLPFLGRGIGDGVSSRSGSEVQRKEDLPISSQVEKELQQAMIMHALHAHNLQYFILFVPHETSTYRSRWAQFYLLMGMEKTGHPEPEAVPSSESSMFRSFSGSPDEASSLRPRSSNNTTANSCHHPAEVSSESQLFPVTYSGHSRHCDHQCYVNLDTVLNLDEFKCCQEPHNERAQAAQHKNGRGGAFMPYARHLGPKKKPKPGSGGQRAIKAAMSALSRMHMVRLAQWQCYQMELAVAPAPLTGINGNNQQQHVLSERKRREKLNDNFKALRTALPPSSKKDKASVLMRARDYVTTLQSRVSELEEKNRMLLELQHRRNNGGDRGDVSRKKVDVDIRSDEEERKHRHMNFT